jgi:DNA modification methylase
MNTSVDESCGPAEPRSRLPEDRGGAATGPKAQQGVDVSVLVLRGDARALPLPDASVDLVVTSPPYFALRSYTDGGQHYDGQIGSEATPAEYIASLVECTREWMRVLKPSGSIFVNLGDKYSGAQAQNIGGANRAGDSSRTWRQTDPGRTGIPNKSLMLLPERYRIACVDQLGLIARAVIIWDKPNGLPESVTDRVRRSHEDWVCLRKMWPDEPCPPEVVEAVLSAVARHEISVEDGAAILSGELIPAEGFVHLTKQPRYFSAVDEIRQPHARTYTHRDYETFAERAKKRPEYRIGGHTQVDAESGPNPLGKLPGSVWTVPTEPLQVPDHLGINHFAAFPTEWPRRIILGWSPSGICTACGEGRRPVTSRCLTTNRGGTQSQRLMGTPISGGEGRQTLGWERTVTVTGEAECACPDTTAPTRPAVVVDPFGGTGTTALVAAALGRMGVTFDRSADYCRLAAWRTTDRREIAKAMRVAKPPPQADGQEALDLFA